ncbi:MAG: pectinesterase family protein [Steroidobacteraceae bacterium]
MKRSVLASIRLPDLIVALSLGGVSVASAQDMRHVVQPRIPSSCVALRARLSAPHEVLSPAAERHPDTDRIQQAMDHCAAGQAVELGADGDKRVFLSGPLTLRSGVTLLIDANTVLAASANPRVYDITPGSCGRLGERAEGCKPLLSGSGISHSGIMGAGAIDGRGGDRLLGERVTWWELAHQGKVLDRNQKVPGLIVLSQVRDFTMYGITLRDSPRYHIDVRNSDGFTAWGVKIMTPGTTRNTDGIDPISSTNVTIAQCSIHAGDDSVAISSRQGGEASHISVLDNHFYTGHGMSIGSPTSGGVSHVLVRNLTIDGSLNGIRIKSDPSRGGLVHDVKYENVCIRNVTNPIVLTPHYTNFSGSLTPEYRDISLRDVHVVTPGYYIFSGLDPRHVLEVSLDNVFADGVDAAHLLATDARITLGPSLGNLVPSGQDVAVTRTPGSRPGTPLACASRFVPFPALPSAPRLVVKVPPVDRTLYVAADGTGDFWSIQRAIDVAPANGAVISVAPGTYREALTIGKPHIVLRSPYEDAAKTVIVTPKEEAASAAVTVAANDVRVENMTFESASGQAHSNAARAAESVALSVSGEHDVFKNVRVLGKTVKRKP